ncbi:hypothetical protein F511_14636 [Dorcoceras hygrometricum]|uniref:Uncharacterized protein n=1 Tax=Dorcoceras hygrometricum TaxID=472368 RepID=A0A2Z7D3U6_9LAMI|nr:hypothetical protein F511_14636 [Dorcoceras hygrometricum]
MPPEPMPETKLVEPEELEFAFFLICFPRGGDRYRQSGPRPETGFLHQPALEGMTRSAQMDSPRQDWPETIFRRREAAAAAFGEEVALPKSSSYAQHIELVYVRESGIQYLCDPQWFRDTASRGPTTIVAPESQFRTCPTDHDSIGYPRMSVSGESSTTMHRLLHASRSHPIPPPDDPKCVGK